MSTASTSKPRGGLECTDVHSTSSQGLTGVADGSSPDSSPCPRRIRTAAGGGGDGGDESDEDGGSSSSSSSSSSDATLSDLPRGNRGPSSARWDWLDSSTSSSTGSDVSRRGSPPPPPPPFPAAVVEPVASSLCCGSAPPPAEGGDDAAAGGVLRREVLDLLESGQAALRSASEDCVGGTYLIVDRGSGGALAVWKPRDEEPGAAGNPKGLSQESDMMKDGFQVGSLFRRERAAFVADGGFAGVPETDVVEIPGRLIGRSSNAPVIGSIQRFVRTAGESWDFLPGKFPAAAVRRIALLDLVILNCDRHGGNILVQQSENGAVTGLVPIDHGLVYPASLADLEFEWIMWPQAKTEIDAEEAAWVARLPPPAECVRQLRTAGIEPEAAELAAAAALAVKTGVGLGMTVRELAECWRRPYLTEPSVLEKAISASRREQGDCSLACHICFEELASQLRTCLSEFKSASRH
eukprot:TRINITY_DN5928_c0_g4_i1.p1 TRINITY_DN5928_c0_g4~~TRINITY_DN5928_c0_g4_i1.p1  ORF type:complete len:466 (+),score=73.89 TRINITY_DN5928_c0_g4_i1:136-1533(+)